MVDKIVSSKDLLMRIVRENIAIDCIAVVGEKLLVGVTHGMEPSVIRSIESKMKEAGLDYAVGWEISISRYPVMAVRSREWVYNKEGVL